MNDSHEAGAGESVRALRDEDNELVAAKWARIEADDEAARVAEADRAPGETPEETAARHQAELAGTIARLLRGLGLDD